MFVGRESELRRFRRFFEDVGMSMALVYGRRRVGKSELIKQAVRESAVPGIYYECKQTSELNNASSLAAVVSERFNLPEAVFPSMEQVLAFLFRRAERRKLILVLDEYPYLRRVVPGLDSIIQSLVDRYKDSSLLKLVLCGSFVETMKGLREESNPLYGRVSLDINLKPMDYYESAFFYPSFSNEDKVRLFSVFGGIPYFNSLIDPALSVRKNIQQLIADPDARLENEISMYLRSEIARIVNANEVFEALAKGYSRFSDILSQSHVSSSPALVDVLGKLISMEVVERVFPINDERNRRRKSYFISDPLSLFFYRYIFRFASQRAVMNNDVFYDRYVEKDFETSLVPKAFERICRQFLIRQNRLGLLEEPFTRIGKYYYDDPRTKTNGEFDIVTEDDNGYVFYEAKFRKSPVTDAMVSTEIAQVNATGFECYRYGFFSRSGFEAKERTDCRFFTLDDFYQ